MQTANQPNNRTLLLALIGVFVIGLVWWTGPQTYVATADLLPANWSSSISTTDATMERRIGQLEARVATLQSENRRLEATANQSVNVGTTTLPENFSSARVLARPPKTAYDVLLIDAGREQGVAAGNVVWWPPGVYLGEIIEVRPDNSLVRLVSSAGVRHTGRLDSRVTVTTEGRGGGAMRTTIPADISIATGTAVISDRWGVPFARVVKKEPAAALAKQRLLLQPIVPASVIEQVYVEQ